MKYAWAFAAAVSCCALACRAESPPAPSPEALLACARLQDPGERVRCYDAQVAAMSSPAAPGPANGASAPPVPAVAAPAPAVSAAAVPAPPAPAVTAPAAAVPPAAASAPPPASAAAAPAKIERSSATKFGAEFLPQASRPPVPENERVLRSSITQVTKRGATVFFYSLANGQVWREDGTQYTFFHAGDDVSITKGTLGSYRMAVPELGTKNWVRVTRIQ